MLCIDLVEPKWCVVQWVAATAWNYLEQSLRINIRIKIILQHDNAQPIQSYLEGQKDRTLYLSK